MEDNYFTDELTPEDMDALTSDILSSSLGTTEVKEDREKAYCINTFGFEEIEDFKKSKQEVKKKEHKKNKCR